ncbi:hypothetical protein SAMN04489707_102516 [Paenacidovorax caeni]|uniref:Uncharacterized protein n=1 Tax=Paenacidovorax caeni TaxID=343013 RepID=A0A1I7JE02_9BURK|nr:hypothetical protein [Paenacidovorax caeni]SFU83399.1 hypothetical protein SAMN04489707_102516 [Paenacidovorax caeni]
MAQPLEILRLGRSSGASRIDALISEVKDLVVKAWHSPRALQSLTAQPGVRTRVSLAMDPALLKHMQAGEASQQIKDLCTWMQGLGVEYTVGYTPQTSAYFGCQGGHIMTVKIFSD